MPEPRDYDLKGPGDEPTLTVGPPPLPPPPEDRPVGVWIAIGLFVVAAGVAAYIVFGRPAAPPPAEETAALPAAAESPAAPLGAEPAPIAVPPLAESDPLVRDLVNALSAHPRIVAWLATDGLIRNFTTVTSNIAEGVSPAGHLAPLRPSSGFRVVERGDDLFIDPVSFERYNGVADAAASIDPAAAAKVYATLKPRIQEAYGELGFPDQPFDASLERAIVLLLNTPVPPDLVRVEPRGIGYGFVDERLEGLSDAQKQLLRLGPRNMRLVQRALREVAAALGIPAARLPAPRI
jgi:hypothetical protein